jgi:hypothetical protein
MTDPGDLYALIEASAWLLGLKIREEWCEAVGLHLSISLDHARNVAEFPLPDEAEPAPVFKA